MSEGVCILCEQLKTKRESQRMFADAFKAIQPLAKDYAKGMKLSTITIAQSVEMGNLLFCHSDDERLGKELREIKVIFI